MIEGWDYLEIDKVTKKTKQRDPSKEPNKPFIYIDVSSVSNELFCVKEVNLLIGKEAPSRARKIVNYEDVIFATVRPTLKRIAFIEQKYDNEICSTGYCVLKADKSKILPLFLFFTVLTDRFIERIEKLQRGASYPAIRDSDLKLQKISVPPLPEQQKIAYVLRTVQKAIEQQEKIIRTTTELKKALMQKLFTEGTKDEPQKETEIGLVPQSWEVVELGQRSDIMTSFPTYSKVKDKFLSTGHYEFHYLKVSDMNIDGNETVFKTSNNIFFTNNLSDFNKGFIKPNSIVFPKRGAAIATNKKRITSCYSILDPNLIGVEPDNSLNSNFLYYFFETFDLTKLQDNNVIPQLNKHNVAGVIIPLPSKEEQGAIIKIIDIISNKLSYHQKKKETLNELFKTLLHELMTGTRRVHDIEFEKQ